MSKQIVSKMVLILTAVIVIAGCAPVAGTGAGVGENGDTVSVTGYGEAFGDPDIATVSFGYSTSDAMVSSALERTNMSIERITNSLIQLGIADADIQTTNFSVWPEDQYDPLTGQLTGVRLYRVENQLRVVIRDISQVAKVIQTALDQGANNVYGLTFGIDDTAAIAALARSAAVADAKVRAEQLAVELGAQLGQPRVASESFGGTAYPAAEFAFGIGGGGDGPISEGQLAISVQVHVTFDLIR